jgi:enoyl-CoA hydratase/carnithine racemase
VRKDGNTLSSHWTDPSPSSNSTERNSTDHTTILPTYRLNFPKRRRNSITVPVMNDLVAAYDLFDRDDRVRVVILTADHTAFAFCSGVRDHLTYL